MHADRWTATSRRLAAAEQLLAAVRPEFCVVVLVNGTTTDTEKPARRRRLPAIPATDCLAKGNGHAAASDRAFGTGTSQRRRNPADLAFHTVLLVGAFRAGVQ